MHILVCDTMSKAMFLGGREGKGSGIIVLLLLVFDEIEILQLLVLGMLCSIKINVAFDFILLPMLF